MSTATAEPWWQKVVQSPEVRVLAAVTLLLLLVILFLVTSQRATDRMATYATILYGVSVLGTFVLYLITTLQFNELLAAEAARRKRLLEARSYAELHEGDLHGQFADAYPYGFRMWQEMNSDDADLQAMPTPSVPDASREAYMNDILATNVFNNIENTNVFLGGVLADYTRSEAAGFIRLWRLWLQSPTLRAYWPQLSLAFSQNTRDLINTQMMHAWEPWPY
jgi:hypothetical protein